MKNNHNYQSCVDIACHIRLLEVVYSYFNFPKRIINFSSEPIIGFSRGVIVATLEHRMVQGGRVRTPPTTVPGHDMAGDVKSALILFQLGIRPQGK